MKPKQSLSDLTARVFKKFEPVLARFRPDLVLVHGDTTTTLAGALSAFYARIPVGHVEAGLRTRNIYQPFPEEVNRRVTDVVTALHFAPTKESAASLRKEGVSSESIFVTGNTVIDALLDTAKKNKPPRHKQLRSLSQAMLSSYGQWILLTAHRRENFGKPFQEICKGIRDLSRRFPQVHWVYPVHLNPHIKGPAVKYFKNCPNIHMLPPLDYSDLVWLLKRCRLVVTDSGGLQEEAPALGKPVLVLRNVTERPEAVHAGTVRVIGTSARRIRAEVSALLSNGVLYRKMSQATSPYGDGRASERILNAVQWYFDMKKKKPRPYDNP